jgi:hypothetical protein
MDDENLPQTEDIMHEFLRVDDLRMRVDLAAPFLNESDITAITAIVFSASPLTRRP